MGTFTVAPKIAPGDVEVEWLPNDTAMNVSFTRLTIVEANSIHINYFIRYSSSPLVKRDVDNKTVKMNDGSTTVIGGLDPYLDYHVVVDATNSHGTKSSSPYLLHAGQLNRVNICNELVTYNTRVKYNCVCVGIKKCP